jgi:uncharacterized phiE125 gp8 family phage protein
MPLSLITPPANTPVTLAEARAWLRVDGSEEDVLITALIEAATRRVEFECGLALITQRWRYLRDCWPRSGWLALPIHPVQAVESLRVLTEDGLTPVPAEAYEAHLAGRPARILAREGFPRPGRGIDVVQVELRAGFGDAPADVPAELRQAILLLVAHWFENREGVVATGWQGLPAEAVALMSPWREVAL